MRSSHLKTSYRPWLLMTLLLLLLLILLLVGSGVYFYYQNTSWATVHYLTPDDEIAERVRIGKEHALHGPVEIEGYTFLHWRDEQGNAEKRESVTVYEDVWYAAEYAIALTRDEHPVYLFPDENGYYRPQDPMLRSDVVTMLHILLGKPGGSGSFLDVDAKAPYAKAAAALKDLGLISGSRLHPDEAITRGELLEMLAVLYPSAKEDYVFADVEKGQPFYDACWQYCRCVPHSIFTVGQANMPLKGIHQLLQALPDIVRQYPDTTVRIAGDKVMAHDFRHRMTYGQYMQHLIRRHHLQDHVTFLGALNAEQIVRELERANIFILPSSIENSPNALGEAQLAGTPCVAANVGGVADLVPDSTCGQLYPYDNTQALSNAVCRTFKTSDSFDNAPMRRISRERHNPETNRNRLVQIYHSILQDS